uniref:ribosomal protein S3 n=1 Tax=Peniophora lycii TaxID=154539 RepID=UPI001BED8378|nr:ribosomal protein S3 [Peniophora lycii]QUA00859.1 ribosomal protein S3 [Peniophora lycii]
MQENISQLSSLVYLPVSNNNKEVSITNSSVQSLLEHNNKLNEIKKENSKGTTRTINSAIASSNNLTQHLTIDSLPVSSKVDIMLDVQKNSDNYLNVNPSPSSKNEANKYFLEEVLSIIASHIRSNRKKIYLTKVLRKISRIKYKIRKNKLQLPVYSIYLQKRIPLILDRIQLSEDKKKLLREQKLQAIEQKRIKAIQQKEFILHNLKAKYSNIEILKDTNSISYKNLSIIEQKWIDTLNFIDSKSLTTNKLNTSENKNLIFSTTELISSIGNFDPLYGANKNIMFTFNKKNTYKILKNRKNIATIFKSAFSSMDSLISKPFFSIKPNLLIIDLFFFWKPLYKRNKNSKLYSKFSIIFERELKFLSLLITKYIKSNTNLNLTRTYYPYNDSNIFAYFLGSLSFFFSYIRLIRNVFHKLNMRINKRKNFRLKYRNIPSVVSGMEINFAGRMLNSKAKKRVKDQNMILGSLARKKSYLKTSSNFTSKTKGGAFNIAVTQKSTFVK